jgi:hypothetical protein
MGTAFDTPGWEEKSKQSYGEESWRKDYFKDLGVT